MSEPPVAPSALLAGRTVLVTGATGVGVGAGVVAAVAALGARLVLNGLGDAELEPVLARWPDAIGVVGDVSDPAAVERMLDSAQERAGVPLDGLVNNAGVGLTRRAHEADAGDFDRVHDVDVRGVWAVSRGFARRLIAAGGRGAIVNVSSVHARATEDRYAIYASAKAAVEGLTRGMAVELGPHAIRVNAIAPGYVHSEQGLELLAAVTADAAAWARRTVERDQALPEPIGALDCGWAAGFLLSDLAHGVSGQSLAIDAGMTAQLTRRDAPV
ncbi:SDR family oxidoreductase [Conexibacter sp. JD483]|uniref:SDR family NAD(P)-dependent oxidoreductase n=1 Tax=unclassified Conexibacter TaxID=2627773 RepID=UPI002724481D|nr:MULTISPECIES: SDR family oxidoreductase [unclassified Conexibacter]MDO8185195.1 SDR family oxidoreductase [Conexibacter sp. CPCC 205706]MDO8198241.1 SDR family oxidoreductase [Conexibacter sp. CPCC 205762]MDR9367797.1 SDR family oxidoreductase [Conexibacter sp. JD483]